MKYTNLKTLFSACMLAAAFIAGNACAWEPKKPIQIIVGFSPGGGTDVIARALAAAAPETMPVPLVVINRPGASGVIAAEFVANAAPDGYTLLVAGGSESTSLPNHQQVPYNLATSFRPIVHVIRLRMMIVVRSDSKIRTFKDLVAYAKANPGKLAYGTSGVGSLTHSLMMVVDKVAGIETFHVPYKGDAPVVTALIGDQIQVGTGSPDQFKPWIDSGKVIPLAVSSNDRFPGYPDVPTLKELGYDIYLENMKGIVAPAGLPDDVYTYLHDRLKKTMETETFKAIVARASYEVQYMDGPTFGKNMQNMSDAIAAALKK
jgi:tripartite-type tricarboxylate transporter receptor subunit TctC